LSCLRVKATAPRASGGVPVPIGSSLLGVMAVCTFGVGKSEYSPAAIAPRYTASRASSAGVNAQAFVAVTCEIGRGGGFMREAPFSHHSARAMFPGNRDGIPRLREIRTREPLSVPERA